MLGILLIICLVIFWITKLKAFILLKDTYNKPENINDKDQIRELRHHAVKLHIIAGIAALIGYIGCILPLLIAVISKNINIFLIIVVGIVSPLILSFVCYLEIRSARGTKIVFPFTAYLMVFSLPLFYTSYCCIDYDFFRKDYTAAFNSMGAEPNQSENA
ncbi:MAG: hypothetical protein LLF92_00640 [Planctomycetaceae bacterium]|nr:hypothetical protein [Planctomycetaceae bacterium]